MRFDASMPSSAPSSNLGKMKIFILLVSVFCTVLGAAYIIKMSNVLNLGLEDDIHSFYDSPEFLWVDEWTNFNNIGYNVNVTLYNSTTSQFMANYTIDEVSWHMKARSLSESPIFLHCLGADRILIVAEPVQSNRQTITIDKDIVCGSETGASHYRFGVEASGFASFVHQG